MTDRIDEIGAADLRVKLADVLDQLRFDRKPVALTRFGKVAAWVIPAGFKVDGDLEALLELSKRVQEVRNEESGK
jgi:hypothetical protein